MIDSLIWAAVVTMLVTPPLMLLRERRGGADRSCVPAVPAVLSEAPCHHVVPDDVAEFMIPDFRPGIDTCRIELRDPEAEFDAVIDETGVRFQFLDGNSFLEVVFAGLAQPPFADTWIFGPGPAASGTVLSDLVGREPLSRGPDFHRVRSEIAAFQTFSVAEEVVEVWVPPETAVLPRIDIRPTADGSDGELVIDGRPAARLCGAPDAGARNIRIIRMTPGDFGAESRLSA